MSNQSKNSFNININIDEINENDNNNNNNNKKISNQINLNQKNLINSDEKQNSRKPLPKASLHLPGTSAPVTSSNPLLYKYKHQQSSIIDDKNT